jgi:hypothetical protein
MKISEISEVQPTQQPEVHEVSLSKAEQLDEVMLFFRENPSAPRQDFLALDKALGITREELENLEFELCKSLCSKIGKHVNHGNEDVDQDELQKGIEHELEHTNDEYIARLIALDHLSEMPDYYTKLSAVDKD